MSSILRICMFNYHKRTRQLTNSNQPIACLSDQQAGHVTHRAGTGYTALYTFFNNWLQSVPAGTGYTALHTCFNNWLQSVPTGTGYTVLYTCFNLPVTKSTDRVLATQSLLYSASPQQKKKKKKEKKRSWLNIAQ